MKISTLLLMVAAAFLRAETADGLGATDRPAPPRPGASLEPGPPPARTPRLSNLRFPLFPPPLS